MTALGYLRDFGARVENRLSRYFYATPFKLANRQPIVSFTFDDFPESAASFGVPLLDKHHAKATFYVSGGEVGKWSGLWQVADAESIVDLHRRGHEIACHTFSHARAADLDATGLAGEIEQNRRYLLGLDPSIKIENFAYPYGLGSVWHKPLLAKHFRSSRGIIPGINRGTIDLQYLRSTPLIDRHIDNGGINRTLDELAASNGWLIFYGHDIATKPSPFGCTPDLLRHALSAAAKRNIAIMTVAEALRASGL
ncbi:polysaccharide deacetylase family protein [Bradyrhizobium sp.]|uniref:polysaccharide deacetylase family protein n=1 Tax=Bradyrhizobium sp. TaxID=376 RepID=UPI002382021B|nr:polysaccharide deacetylase family protein [Bradyrhizobium sp.]MDE1933447.1 polysaccharide deacetylase family protein [Bradyrhizobium sp.]